MLSGSLPPFPSARKPFPQTGHTMFRISRRLPVFLSILLLSATVQAASDNWLPQAQRMNRDTVRKEDRRARQHALFTGSLAQGGAMPRQLTLHAGKHYTFFADCSRQCADIDLSLLRDGQLLTADTDPHAAPMFGWHARQSGQYTLTLTMPRCTGSKCAYSIQVFEGSQKIL